MRLTIGLPSYNNYTEVFFTIQSLRMHHDLTGCEILVIDNFGDAELEKFIRVQGGGVVRYEKCVDGSGPAYAKNKVFELARGEMVMCIDSHILLALSSLKNIPVTDNLVHGTLMYCDIKNYSCEWLPEWRGHMWGVWGKCLTVLPQKPFEIWGCGCGLFLTKRDSWLRFNDRFKGFGGEEGYLQEKYRRAGRKVLCYPNIVWMHLFDRKIPYQVRLIDRVRNYLIGFEEIGLDVKPVVDHFGLQLVEEARRIIATETEVERSKKLEIVNAEYGAGDIFVDVLDLVKAQDKDDVFKVDNKFMGRDPNPGVKKTLEIAYVLDDKSFNVSIKENDFFKINSLKLRKT